MICENVKNRDSLLQFCDEQKLETLVAYLREILTINEHLNLTSIKNFDDACLLHLEDSLVAVSQIMAAIDGGMCDIGSGGGFPGVPLGVATGRRTTLVDSRAKKIKAVMQTVHASHADDFAEFEGVAERIEDFGRERRGKFAVVTARALSSLPSLFELASPLLKIEGSFVALKSEIESEEEDWGLRLAPKLGFELVNKCPLTLSDGETKRVIYTFQRTHESAVKLPRKVGLAQKQPLKA